MSIGILTLNAVITQEMELLLGKPELSHYL